MSKPMTRKYAKRREMTSEYAKGVDGINTARPPKKDRSHVGAGRNFPPKTETIASCPPSPHIHHRPRQNRRGCTSRPRTWRGSATRSKCAAWDEGRLRDEQPPH